MITGLEKINKNLYIIKNNIIKFNNDKWIFNSNYEQRKESDMDLTLSAIAAPEGASLAQNGREKGDILVNMIEMGAKEVLEKVNFLSICVLPTSRFTFDINFLLDFHLKNFSFHISIKR